MHFDLLHKIATTHIKWNGKMSTDVIQEAIGNRQGGYSSKDEWKVYGNPMLKELEKNAIKEDFIAGAPTNVNPVDDDVATCSVGKLPGKHCTKCNYCRTMLKFTEHKNHMESGRDK